MHNQLHRTRLPNRADDCGIRNVINIDIYLKKMNRLQSLAFFE